MFKAYNLRVYGKVQRVGFRRYVLEHARRLKLAGQIKNELDDSVSIFIQGEKENINKFIEVIKNAPQPIYIENISIQEETPKKELKYFTIVYGDLGEELQEGFGAMQEVFMQHWKELKEFRNEFKDFRNEFGDFRREVRESFFKIDEKYGEISIKLTKILEILVNESRETRELILENIKLTRDVLEKILKEKK